MRGRTGHRRPARTRTPCCKSETKRSITGDAYDNALAEAFFATLEVELLDRHTFIDRSTARRALFDYIEGWYNQYRWHSALGYLSPAAYERRWSDQSGVA